MTLLLPLLALGALAAFAIAYVVLEFVVGPRDRARDAAKLDELITPLTTDNYRFKGQDDSLRVNAVRRRREADGKRREAAQIASGKPAVQIYLVVNE